MSSYLSLPGIDTPGNERKVGPQLEEGLSNVTEIFSRRRLTVSEAAKLAGEADRITQQKRHPETTTNLALPVSDPNDKIESIPKGQVTDAYDARERVVKAHKAHRQPDMLYEKDSVPDNLLVGNFGSGANSNNGATLETAA